LIPRGFGFSFKNIKRVNSPALKFYSPINGLADNVLTILRNNATTPVLGEVNTPLTTPPSAPTGAWTENYKSGTGVSYFANTVTAISNILGANTFPEGLLLYHYTCDARLGIIN
jgi:hypothetical protein